MNKNHKLIYAFLLALFAQFLFPCFFPFLRVYVFLPFFLLLITSSELTTCLWISLGVGIFTNLLSSHQLGIDSLAYIVSSSILYRYKGFIFFEKPLHFSCFTAIYSILFSIIFSICYFLFDRRLPISGKWFVSDIILCPCIDALYGLLWIYCPLIVMEKLERKFKMFWLQKKRRG